MSLSSHLSLASKDLAQFFCYFCYNANIQQIGMLLLQPMSESSRRCGDVEYPKYCWLKPNEVYHMADAWSAKSEFVENSTRWLGLHDLPAIR